MSNMLSNIENSLSRDGQFNRWLRVEQALASAQAVLGIIPEDIAAQIKEKANVKFLEMDRYDELYQKTGHPMVSMLRLLEDAIGCSAGQYIHLGATTQDIIDTAMVLAMKETMEEADRVLREMLRSACSLAEKYANTPMMGRTHNVQALPITFGYKAAIWASELDRCLERLAESRKRVLAVQLSGAVGKIAVTAFQNHQNFEEELCKNDEITAVLSPEQIHEALDPLKYIGKCPEMAAETATKIRTKYAL